MLRLPQVPHTSCTRALLGEQHVTGAAWKTETFLAASHNLPLTWSSQTKQSQNRGKAWQHFSIKQELENWLLQLSLKMAQTGSVHCCYRLSHRHCNPSTCWIEGEMSTRHKKQQQFHWLIEPWVHIPSVGAAQLRAGTPGTAAAAGTNSLF